jgi:hypothetical protein
MARALFPWCFLLVLGCVDRDLRPELFACDSGGTCSETETDAGPPVNCPLGNTCTCQAGRACNFNCIGSCVIECLEGSTCGVDCSAASCTMNCRSGAECNLSCNTGDCTSTCEESAMCSIECVVSQCTCTGPTCPL